jgi:glycosyltransferase involved in cell wall biosynthesis
MVEGKQIDLLLRAYGRVKRIYDEASLMLIGDGPLRPVLEEQARRLRLDDIAFLGYIEDQIGLADLLYTASLYVLPGLGGLGINTAMACGLPVICSRGDGTERDLVQEGLNGWFFAWNSEEDLARVILQAISAPEQLARAGTESLRLIQERYNLDRMVDAFLDRVERTLEGRGRR